MIVVISIFSCYFFLKKELLRTGYNNYYFRCDSPNDDPFRACFGCEEDLKQRSFFHNYTNHFKEDFINRQTGERFRATRPSRRLICSNTINRNSCKIRVDRAMEIRDVTYMQALQVIQSEEYLIADDLDILRYHIV